MKEQSTETAAPSDKQSGTAAHNISTPSPTQPRNKTGRLSSPSMLRMGMSTKTSPTQTNNRLLRLASHLNSPNLRATGNQPVDKVKRRRKSKELEGLIAMDAVTPFEDLTYERALGEGAFAFVDLYRYMPIEVRTTGGASVGALV